MLHLFNILQYIYIYTVHNADKFICSNVLYYLLNKYKLYIIKVLQFRTLYSCINSEESYEARIASF